MDFDKFLGEMQKLIVASQQRDMFGNKEMFIEKSAEICETFLKGQGYSVGPPHKYPSPVNKADELISMFYSFMRGIYQKHLWSYPDEKRDRSIAKAFIERRMESGKISRKVALQQCGLIIQTVFKHPEIFKFDTAPNFGIFGQADMGWLTERALQIINKQIADYEAKAVERSVNEMTERIEEKYPNEGFSLVELEAFRNKLENQYGKKER